MNGIKYVWKMRTLFCGLIGVVFFSVSLLGQGGSDKIDLLIVDGFSNHDWKQTTLIRAAEWLAKGKTSYKVPADFPTETDLSLRTFKE